MDASLAAAASYNMSRAIIRLYQQTRTTALGSMTTKQIGKTCCPLSRVSPVQAFARSVGSTLMTPISRLHHVATFSTAHALTLGSKSSSMQVAPYVDNL